MTSLFDHWPLQWYYRLEGTDLSYDVDGNLMVKRCMISQDRNTRVSETYHIHGSRRTMNRIFTALTNGVSPIPDQHVMRCLQSDEMVAYPVRTTVPVVRECVDDALAAGKITFIGPSAGGISLHGMTTDVLTSALHKYVRRGFYWKAMWCLVERDIFNDLSIREPSQMLKAFSTRMINRLGPIMCCEDVGLGNAFLPMMVDEIVSELSAKDIEPDRRRQLYFTLVHELILSEKSRELSHLRATYHTAFMLPHFRNLYKDTLYEGLDDVPSFEELYASQKPDRCFVPLFQVLFSETQRTKDVLKMVDHATRESGLRYKPLLQVLRKWFLKYKFKEAWMFAAQVVLISIRKPLMRIPKLAPSSYASWYVHWYRNLTGPPITIDDYCVDVHTREGKKRGKNVRDFCDEGAIVFNESRYTTHEYKEIYSAVKRYRGDVIPEPFVPSPDVPVGQILTSAHKRYTYFPGDGTLAYKGPWNPAQVGTKFPNLRTRIAVVKVLDMDDHILAYELRDGWMISRNLSRVPVSSWKMETKQGGCDTSPMRVVKRESMGVHQLSSLDADGIFSVLFGPPFLYKYYMLMAALGTGDMGPWNCIYGDDPKGSMIVDYEDNSHRERITRPSHVFARENAVKEESLAMGMAHRREEIIRFIEFLESKLPTMLSIVEEHGSNIDVEKNVGMLREFINGYY